MRAKVATYARKRARTMVTKVLRSAGRSLGRRVRRTKAYARALNSKAARAFRSITSGANKIPHSVRSTGQTFNVACNELQTLDSTSIERGSNQNQREGNRILCKGIDVNVFHK